MVGVVEELVRWRGALDRRWHPMELASMIVGFVLFWPIGLAILGWK